MIPDRYVERYVVQPLGSPPGKPDFSCIRLRQRMNGKQRMVRWRGLVAFHSFVAKTLIRNEVSNKAVYTQSPGAGNTLKRGLHALRGYFGWD